MGCWHGRITLRCRAGPLQIDLGFVQLMFDPRTLRRLLRAVRFGVRQLRNFELMCAAIAFGRVECHRPVILFLPLPLAFAVGLLVLGRVEFEVRIEHMLVEQVASDRFDRCAGALSGCEVSARRCSVTAARSRLIGQRNGSTRCRRNFVAEFGKA